MKKNIVMLVIIFLLVFILVFGYIKVKNNKTFLSNTYIGVNGEEIFIPKYSYFKDECCFTAATFYSLKSKKALQKEIDIYMSEFKYFEDKTTYGYKKGDLFIQKYEVENVGLYRKIIII